MSNKLICTVALAASVLFAQAPSGLVRLNVTALDAAGAPVDDLKIGDLQVTDQGKGEKIVFFRQKPSTATAAPLAPHEFSNRTAAAPARTSDGAARALRRVEAVEECVIMDVTLLVEGECWRK